MFSLTNWADGTSGTGPVDSKLPLGKLAATDAKVIFIQLLKTPTQTAMQLSCRHIKALIFIRFLLTSPHHPAWESKFCKKNRQTLDAAAGQVGVPEQPGRASRPWALPLRAAPRSLSGLGRRKREAAPARTVFAGFAGP